MGISQAAVWPGEIMKTLIRLTILAFGLALLAPVQALADTSVCPRPAAQSEIVPGPDLYSENGVLEVSFSYYTAVDDKGRTLFCFVTPDGKESPTLHLHPGDTLTLHVTDMVPNPPLGGAEMASNRSKVCGDSVMTAASVNVHFHGLNTSPKCHSDEVIHTLIGSGETFDYSIKIPSDEPPGLYWYHPHVHGIASSAVQGGATGAIVIEGIENIQPAVAGLPERVLVLRDQRLGDQNPTTINPPQPFWDVSVNYVPVDFPSYTPGIIKTQTGTQEFWRVVNAAANTIMDIQVVYDGVAQPLQIVGFDGVPTGSQDGKREGTIVTQTDILLAPASRAEFIIAAPSANVRNARLITRTIDGGPGGDSNPYRPLALIQSSDQPVKLAKIPARSGPPNAQRFEYLADAKVTAKRSLYFSEIPSTISHKPPVSVQGGPGFGQANPFQQADPFKFYITVKGQFQQLFDPSNPPAIVTNRGAVEEWTIENHTAEVHEFHMHQIHFLVQEVNGVAIPKDQQQFYDTFQVPYWSGKGRYPSIKVRMDFRGAVVGDFVYHCHILDHEDGGMMAIIRVKAGKT
jgi:FtsP/CotA-like multicopper oxidase with cupredoxin domain